MQKPLTLCQWLFYAPWAQAYAFCVGNSPGTIDTKMVQLVTDAPVS